MSTTKAFYLANNKKYLLTQSGLHVLDAQNEFYLDYQDAISETEFQKLVTKNQLNAHDFRPFPTVNEVKAQLGLEFRHLAFTDPVLFDFV